MANPPGNERLTAMTGAVLLVLFIAECYTLLHMGSLLTLHVFLGFLLLGPVSLKIASTLWRFTRYYTRSAPYVKRGPPALLPRVLGPLNILTTVTVLGSGVMLVVVGPGSAQQNWHQIHHLSFLLWALVMIVHLAYYLPRLPRLLTGKTADQAQTLLAARTTRWLLLSGSLAAGAIIAVLSYHLVSNWGG